MSNGDMGRALIAICVAAGEEIMDVYGSNFEVQTKSDKSPLTQADLRANAVILSALEKLDPGTPILSEESADIPWSERQHWQKYWLVDPLDGTKEFVKRNGEFTVNIALIEAGYPSMGVVYVPVTGVAYIGQKGLGAFRQIDGAQREEIFVSEERQPLRVVGSRSHASERLRNYVSALGDVVMVSMGSSLKICLVAEGRADLYPRLGLTSEWDTAAAQAVVEAAGGSLTSTNMQRLAYNTKSSLLNPDFFVFGNSLRDWSALLA